MRALFGTACLLTLLLSALACGDQLVEFPLDRGSRPAIVSTFPLHGATSVPVGSVITATFSHAMDAASIDEHSFTVTQGATPIMGAVSLDSRGLVATFSPVVPFRPGLLYTAMVTTDVEDENGLGLLADYTWSYTLANIDVVELRASAQRVTAPDYELDVSTIMLLIDAHGVVLSVSGSATLSAVSVSGQSYALWDGADLDTYAELDGAFVSATKVPLTLSIPATAFALVHRDLTTTQTRTLIVANTVDGVRSYQAFAITFHATR